MFNRVASLVAPLSRGAGLVSSEPEEIELPVLMNTRDFPSAWSTLSSASRQTRLNRLPPINQVLSHYLCNYSTCIGRSQILTFYLLKYMLETFFLFSIAQLVFLQYIPL